MLRLMERRHSLYGQKSDACVGLQERGVWKPSDFVSLTIYLKNPFLHIKDVKRAGFSWFDPDDA